MILFSPINCCIEFQTDAIQGIVQSARRRQQAGFNGEKPHGGRQTRLQQPAMTTMLRGISPFWLQNTLNTVVVFLTISRFSVIVNIKT